MRLSLLYALLDCADRIELVHIEAALALWRYCEASARMIYGDRLGIRDADLLDDALDHAGKRGMTRQEIGERLFSNHGGAKRIDGAVGPLIAAKRIVEQRKPTGGRYGTLYVHVDYCGDAG